MTYGHSDLGYRPVGAVVEVKLSGNAANVRLRDTANYARYQRRQDDESYGGHVTRSPFRIAIPYSGHWHVVVDFGGHAGRVRFSVKVLQI